MEEIYKKGWFLASALSLLFVIAVLAQATLLQDFEEVMYDSGITLTHRQPGNAAKIAIVAIDDQSIDEIGTWPWSRNVMARMLDKLSKARAKVIGLQVDLSQEQGSSAIKQVNKLKNYLYKHPIRNRSQRRTIGSLVYGLENILKGDSHLARSIARARNVILPMHFTIREPKKGSKGTLPHYIAQNRLSNIVKSKKANADPFKTSSARYPLTSFGDSALAVGFTNISNNAHNGRTNLLALDYHGDLYPSLPLLLAAKNLYLRTSRIKVDLNKDSFHLGRLRIKTDEALRMYPAFYTGKNNASAFNTYSFVDVLNGKVPLSKFRNRIVIIGQTAFNTGTRYATPVNNNMAEPELTANIVASVLNQDFYTRPNWTLYAELLLIVGVWVYLVLVFPRVNPGLSIFLSALITIGLLVSGLVILLGQKVWLQTVTPVILLIVGHLALTIRGIVTGERQSMVVSSDSVETNRMLGLTFQSQGQLDMAMDKFRKLPVDESVLELIYNLALDFERKRLFNKASAAYDYIIRHKPRFRDVKERKKRAEKVEGTMMIGGGGTVMLDSGSANPTLGRYVVESELGRGAMGIVYLGKDPKINRTVAIKTLDLSAEFEQNEIQSVKERFFREAETAGRLNHPGIVTIFDAGEEHDLAYIAMEFLEGEDLSEILLRKKKTDPAWVLHIISEAADALDYAHHQDVVHRDIKPANIMYNDSDQSIKITDFGIARITASNRTKTGVVLGTPSYMSPEQLSGKHIDGRSDLFSLGVMMFEMLTGEQPFGGDSLASLMYQITNEKHPDINKLRADLPKCIKPIIDKALQKNPKKRFQTGAEFKEAVDKCWESF
jgi:CHASE2 domain-containing sensor protein